MKIVKKLLQIHLKSYTIRTSKKTAMFIVKDVKREGGMRKKSHISLAKYLMNSEGMESIKHHKGAFYIGSVLPDCVPSFLVRKHTIEDSFDVLEKEIYKLVSHYNTEKSMDGYFYIHLGVITH